MKKTIAITCGDINGIGPEISLKAIQKINNRNINFIFLCPNNVYEHYKKSTNFTENLIPVQDINNLDTNHNYLFVLPETKMDFGKITKESGIISFLAIEESIKLFKNKKINAVVTSPICKEAIKLAGFDFPGHTEIYANSENNNKYTMTFISPKLKAALTTIHIPLKDVPKKLSRKQLENTIKNAYNICINYYKKLKPKIAILGLNPHAGEQGILGKEEIDIIIPTMKNSKYKDYLYGPFPADAFFGNKLYQNYDFIIGHYHDQVLIPFKLLSFEKGVNFTAGLNIIRTSPDHGTAFDIVNKNIASPTSMVEAIKLAYKFS